MAATLQPTITVVSDREGAYETADGPRRVVVCASALDGDLVVVDRSGPRHGFLVERVQDPAEISAVLSSYLNDAAAAGAPLTRQLITAFDLGLASLDVTAEPIDADEDDRPDAAETLACWTADRALGVLHPECVHRDERIAGQETTTWGAERCGRCAGLLARPARLKGRRAGRRPVIHRRRPAEERFHPLPHQEEALEAVATALPDDRGRAQVLMACGTGKTCTAMWAGQAAAGPDGAIVVFVPSLALLAQTLQAWMQHSAYDFAYLAVCSDETVAPEEVDVDDLTQLAPVTGDPQTVAEFLKTPTGTQRLLLCTYHSAPLVIAAQQHYDAPAPAMAVCDEAHRAAGQEGGAFTLVVDRLQADAMVFFTATQHPRMSEQPERFGPVAFRLTFGQAIERGLLCDYRVVVGVCRDRDLAKAAHARQLAELGEHVTDAETAGVQVALLKTMRRHGATRAITFHRYVDRAARFAETLPDVDAVLEATSSAPLHAHHVSGRMRGSVRRARIRELAAPPEHGRVVLSCARVLSEGVDAPAVDLVAIVDPRESQIDIVQIVGRALRTAPGKTTATIFVAVLVDPDNDLDPAQLSLSIDDGPFATVAATLRALASADERLQQRLTSNLLRSYDAHSGPSGAHGSGPEVALPIGKRFGRAFTSHVLEGLMDPWDHRLLLLQTFAARTGHTNVPADHREFGVRLDTWVRAQRTDRRQGRLSSERRAQLEALPGWSWGKSSNRETWQAHYDALCAYAERTGTAYVPVKHIEGELRLGWWANSQRIYFRTGRLGAEQAAQLEALPGWLWDAPGDPWVEGLTALQDFVAREGHTHVPVGHTERGLALDAWVSEQHAHYDAGQLHAQRVARLEAIEGWTWPTARAAGWWSRMTIYVPCTVASDAHEAATLARLQVSRPDAELAEEPRRCALAPDGTERADTRGRPRFDGQGPTAVWRVALSVWSETPATAAADA